MKCKVLKRQGSVILRYVSSAKSPLDEQLVRLLGQGAPALLLPFSVMEASPAATEVHYDITRLVTLSEYAKSPLGVDAVKDLLDQIRQLIDSCMALKLPLKNLVLDANQIYCDPWANHALRFLYLPFEGIAPDVGAMRSFFAGLMEKLKNPDESARPLIARHNAYFLGTAPFNPSDYRAFLSEVTRAPASTPAVSPPLPATADTVFVAEEPLGFDDAPKAETNWRGKHVRVDPGTGVLNQVSWDMVAGQSPFGASGGASPFVGEEAAAPQSFATTVLDELGLECGSETTRLHDDDPATTLPPAPVQESRMRFFLRRRRTGERFEVRGDEFVVGKSKYCSYQVKNTTTISRRHAVFRRDGDECWIEDNGSTNGTSIDGTLLAPHARLRLAGGETIQMSDEDFVFETERA